LAFWDRWDFCRCKILALQLRVELFELPILGTFKNHAQKFPTLIFYTPSQIPRYLARRNL